MAAEHSLAESWAELKGLNTDGRLTNGQCNALFGRFATRAILFLLKKQKEGPEKSKYESLISIKKQFNMETADGLGEPHAGADEDSADASLDQHELSMCNRVATLEEASDPVCIAIEKGFEVRKYYVDMRI